MYVKIKLINDIYFCIPVVTNYDAITSNHSLAEKFENRYNDWRETLISGLNKVLPKKNRDNVALSYLILVVKEELKYYDDGYVIELKVFNTNTKVAVKKMGNEFKYLGSKYNSIPDLSIIFKSYEGVVLLVLGQIGVYEGYAQHRFIVKGDFIKGMPFVRILYYVEGYLFPRFITKNILKEMPKRSSTKANAYLRLLF